MTPNLTVDAEPTVVNCYAFFDRVFPDCGLQEYTEGLFHGEPATAHHDAQQNKIQYLLDECECAPGVRVLDVGCGNGGLLEAARQRGADAVGITISPEQVQRCIDRGLDARLINYRNLDESWFERFDVVIANGSIEHFVQPRDASAGRADDIYRQMFDIFRRLIDPASRIRKFLNTTIHFVRQPQPRDLIASPFRFRWGSDSFHYSLLNRSFGGWYPSFGQLSTCAEGRFKLIKTVDGTYDYHLTSEDWLRRMQVQICHWRSLSSSLRRSLPLVVQQPRQCLTMLVCMFVTQSWNWQFRLPDPPTRLLRQTWEYVAEPNSR